jgi:hypothetical protein
MIMRKRRILTSLLAATTLMAAPLAQVSRAAESVTIIYGPINRSIEVSDIEHLARTGEARGFLATALKLGKQDPKALQSILNQKLDLPLVEASQLLYSSIGEALLTKAGTVVAPRTCNCDGKQALRAAILLALSRNNGQITAVSLLQNYPTEMRVNVEPLLALLEEVGDIQQLVKIFSPGGGK